VRESIVNFGNSNYDHFKVRAAIASFSDGNVIDFDCEQDGIIDDSIVLDRGQFHYVVSDEGFMDCYKQTLHVSSSAPMQVTRCYKHAWGGISESTWGACRFGWYVRDLGVTFIRGDTNADSVVNLADALFTLGYLFAAGEAPNCLDGADANDDGVINLADALRVLGYLFGGQGPLASPAEACSVDPTEDELGCSGYLPCAGP
jgi:hypothetical protein